MFSPRDILNEMYFIEETSSVHFAIRIIEISLRKCILDITQEFQG